MIDCAGAASRRLRAAALRSGLTVALLASCGASAAVAPVPLLAKGQPTDWWFVFKFNSSKSFAGCGPREEGRKRKRMPKTVSASSAARCRPRAGSASSSRSRSRTTQAEGREGCTGATLTDPVGATFDQVYNGSFNT